jgi:prophage antirepressor-like protein
VENLGDNINDIVIYKDGGVALEATVDNDTIWLTQTELVKLFKKDQSVISRHINNIFLDKEVDEKSNMQKMHIANSDKPVHFYSLDIVLAVGYRTNSAKAIKFRQWATSVLKQHLLKGYTLDQKRLDVLEEKQLLTDKKLATVLQAIEDKSLKPKQGIFYDGEVFDAYVFVAGLVKSAKKSIVLIDNYVDESVLTLFSKNADIEVTIYTKSISKQLKLDLKKYNAQHKPISIKTFTESHDRFLIVDGKVVYHFGASLKDLGKKWFAFSRFEMEVLGMLERL